MKFYCDSCNTKYAISDDKVRGKVLKVRCKHCGNIITVRESLVPQAKPPSPPASTERVPQTNWHFSINGIATGPMGLATLRAKYASGEIGDETYVWHDTFDAWRPVSSVSIFAEALKQGGLLKPRFKTNAYTGVTEAVSATPSSQRSGAVPQRKQQPRTPETKATRPTVDQDKLEKLRSKIMKPAEKKSQPSPSYQPTQEQSFRSETGGIAPADLDSAVLDFSAMQPTSQGIDPVADTMESKVFTTPVADKNAAPIPNLAQPTDLFGHDAETYGLDADSDAISFFPETPVELKTNAPTTEHSSVSHSLLIQLGNIKKVGRKRTIGMFIGVALLFFIISGVGIYMFMNRKIINTEISEKSPEREAKFLTYNKKKISAGLVFELPEVALSDVIESDDEVEEVEEVEEKKKSPKKREAKHNNLKKIAKKVSQKKGSKKPESAADIRKRLLSSSLTAINRPKDTIGSAKSGSAGLTRVKAQAGFKKVARSVGICRQRHANRSGKALESAKVRISVEVLPTGKVSWFKMTPNTLKHTAFDSCMKSKKETWRFSAFGGKAVKINRTFILQ